MTRTFLSAVFAIALTAPAYAGGHASGDPAEGESAFKKCKSCHMVQDADGNDIVKGGKTGPNLWSVVGRTAGAADYKYSKSMIAAGEAGLVWDEEQFVAYVQDPSKYLKTYLDDPKARGKMAYKLRKEEEAINIWAYLASVSPEPEAATN